MDKKEFDDWLGLSELWDQQQRYKDRIKEIPEEKIRECLNVLKLSKPQINHYIRHREELAKELFDMGGRIKKPTH